MNAKPSLRYYVVKNTLSTSKAERFLPRLVMDRTSGFADLAEAIRNNGGQSGITGASLAYQTETFITGIVTELLHGRQPKLGDLLKVSLSVSGDLPSEDSPIDFSKNEIAIRFTALNGLKRILAEALRGVKFQNAGLPSGPRIKGFSGSWRNGVEPRVKQGGAFKLTGFHLNVNDMEKGQGVFFKPASGGTLYAAKIYETSLRVVKARIPADIPLGTYTLLLRGPEGEAKLPGVEVAEEYLPAPKRDRHTAKPSSATVRSLRRVNVPRV